MLSTKNKKIDELDAKLSLRRQPDQQHVVSAELEAHISSELATAAAHILSAITQFNTAIITLKQQASEHAPHLLPKIDSDMSYLYRRLADIAIREGVDIDISEMIAPSWALPDDDDDFELLGQTPDELDD